MYVPLVLSIRLEAGQSPSESSTSFATTTISSSVTSSATSTRSNTPAATNTRSNTPAATNSAAAATFFSYTGANQTYTVPSLCTMIVVHAWGAAGGTKGNYLTNGYGGMGAYVSANVTVTEGHVFNVIVGQGGVRGGVTSTFGGGGAGGSASTTGSASGGGRSAVQLGDLDIITAAGGGGNGNLYGGGDGGCTTGFNPPSAFTPLGKVTVGATTGKGATLTAGGAAGGAGATAGGQYLGGIGYPGTTTTCGGGGGGGYFGGGGKFISIILVYLFSVGGNAGDGGGGGSGGACPSGSTLCQAGSICTTNQNIASRSSPYWPGGTVGQPVSANTGGNGYVAIGCVVYATKTASPTISSTQSASMTPAST